MNYLKARTVATLGISKEYDGPISIDDSAPWFYRYTIHRRRHKMSFRELRNVTLKYANEYINVLSPIVKNNLYGTLENFIDRTASQA
ncbi:hypothetical protein [Bartonella pachyuromydis]|uniref:Uncharacterized protein n=1 Tax=Bartonella pachyuromydis TaxID=931097 RepID=A0ABP8VJ79_9HYPH